MQNQKNGDHLYYGHNFKKIFLINVQFRKLQSSLVFNQ